MICAWQRASFGPRAAETDNMRRGVSTRVADHSGPLACATGPAFEGTSSGHLCQTF
jgi:hypothetical protein